MLTLILIDAQYSHKAIFDFEKGSIGKNHSSSGSHSPIKKPSQSPSPVHSLPLSGKLFVAR